MDGNGIVLTLIAKRNGAPIPVQIRTEGLFAPAKAGQGQARRQVDAGGVFRTPVLQFLGDGCQSKQIVVLRPGFVLLERLAPTAHHIVSAVVLQYVFLGVRLMFIFHQSGGEGEVGGFHRRIAVIHADYDYFTHLVSPRCFSFFAALFRSCSFPASSSFRISWRS